MECVGIESGGGSIGSILSPSLVPLFDAFLRKVVLCVAALGDLDSVLRVLVAVLRIPGVVAHKVRLTKGLLRENTLHILLSLHSLPAKPNFLILFSSLLPT